MLGGHAPTQGAQLAHSGVGDPVVGVAAYTAHPHQTARDQAPQMRRDPSLGQSGPLDALGAGRLTGLHQELEQVQAGGVAEGPEELGHQLPPGRLLKQRSRPPFLDDGAGHAAQHDSLATSVVKDWAASLIPSAMVKYGAHVRASWSTVMPASRA